MFQDLSWYEIIRGNVRSLSFYFKVDFVNYKAWLNVCWLLEKKDEVLPAAAFPLRRPIGPWHSRFPLFPQNAAETTKLPLSHPFSPSVLHSSYLKSVPFKWLAYPMEIVVLQEGWFFSYTEHLVRKFSTLGIPIFFPWFGLLQKFNIAGAVRFWTEHNVRMPFEVSKI